jgi:hypothetical protein
MVTKTRLPESAMRSPHDCPLKPPKMTECMAPRRSVGVASRGASLKSCSLSQGQCLTVLGFDQVNVRRFLMRANLAQEPHGIRRKLRCFRGRTIARARWPLCGAQGI